MCNEYVRQRLPSEYCPFCEENSKFESPLYEGNVCINGHHIYNGKTGKIVVDAPQSVPSFVKRKDSKVVIRRDSRHGYFCNKKGMRVNKRCK